MTDMGFGYYTGDQGLDPQDGTDVTQQQQVPQNQDPKGGNGLRQYLNALEEKTKTQQAQLDALLAESARNKVADALEAKGYDRGASALYSGDPTKVDDWLATAGPLLAKKPDPQGQGGAGAGGQGGATGTLDGQAQQQFQQFQNAGQNAAAPQGSDAEQAAVIGKFSTPEELDEYLAGQGNQFAQLWQR